MASGPSSRAMFSQQFQMTNWQMEDIKTSQTEESVSPCSSSLTASASGNPLVSSGFPVSKSNMSKIRINKNSIQTASSSSKINAKAKQCLTNTHQGHLTPLPSLHHHSAHPWNKTILIEAGFHKRWRWSRSGNRRHRAIRSTSENQDKPTELETELRFP